MIKVNGASIEFEGETMLVLGEATCLLANLYRVLVDKYGKERANEYLVTMGRTAVMSDDDLALAVKKKNDELKERFGEDGFAEIEKRINEMAHRYGLDDEGDE